MEKISKVWFDSRRVYIETDAAKVYSRPLEAFPLLLEASGEERLDFTIGRFGDDIRWPSLDEDIHISSFLEDNESQVLALKKAIQEGLDSGIAEDFDPAARR